MLLFTFVVSAEQSRMVSRELSVRFASGDGVPEENSTTIAMQGSYYVFS